MTHGLISAGWISAIIGLITVVFTIGGAWGIIKYEIRRLKEDLKRVQNRSEVNEKVFREAIDSLKDTIKEELERAITRVNKLLFEEGGMTRYMPRSECDRSHETCRGDLMRRIERLEEKSP